MSKDNKQGFLAIRLSTEMVPRNPQMGGESRVKLALRPQFSTAKGSKL